MRTWMVRGLLIGACAAAFVAPAAAEDDAGTDGVTLRVNVEKDATHTFRRELSLTCSTKIGDGDFPTRDYEVAQELTVKTQGVEDGTTRFAVTCATSDVTSSTQGDEGVEKGTWDSTESEPNFDKGGDMMSVAAAFMMGKVLSGKTLGVDTDARVSAVTIHDTRARRAEEKDSIPSSSFAPALLEGIVWSPDFLVKHLPEKAVREGDEVKRPVTFRTKMPRVAVHTELTLKVTRADADSVVLEGGGTPKLHRLERGGAVGSALPADAFTEASITCRLVVSAKDGLPLDVEWHVRGTYHHDTPLSKQLMHETTDLKVRMRRVEAE